MLLLVDEDDTPLTWYQFATCFVSQWWPLEVNRGGGGVGRAFILDRAASAVAAAKFSTSDIRAIGRW